MYTKEDYVMLVHFNKDKAYSFRECGSSLYYPNISNPEISRLTTKDTVTDYYFFICCRWEHGVFYLHRDWSIGQSSLLETSHCMTIWPTAHQCFKQERDNKLSSFVRWRATCSCYLWPSYIHLRREMATKKPKHVEFKQRIPIQTGILKYHPEIPLGMNFWFINGNPYFTKITVKVNCRTVKICRGCGRKDILNRTQALVAQHNKRGFKINEYHVDNESKNI